MHHHPDLEAVQALLEQDALSHEAPPGLAARVFEASLPFLPGRTRARMSWEWESVIAARIPVWGRLAMAALIALAFALATRSLVAPGPAGIPSMLTASAAGLLDDPIAGLERRAEPAGPDVEDLVLTGETTFRDVAADVDAVKADLGNT